MCPGLHRSITACDGTSASALSGIHRSARCGEKTKKRKKKEQGGSLEDFADNYACSVDDL